MIRNLIIKLLLIDFILFTIAGMLFYFFWGVHHIPGLIIALVMTSVNTLVAFYFAEKGMKGSTAQFMTRVFGGMGIRLPLMLGVIILIISFTNLPQYSFIICLFISYLCKSILEIIDVLKLRKQSQLLT
jgi:F0F1-type ATP synthase assembly protein I